MPFYRKIDGKSVDGRRTAERLLDLKAAFEAQSFPRRNLNNNLLLATWNIREFESGKFGLRAPEPIYYIAEIIDRFDIVAVQEVSADLSSLNRLMEYLGGWWKYLLTDVTEGAQGNRERMVFLYDSRKIKSGGFTCEVVLPPVKKRGEDLQPARQLARTPFMVGFSAGWFQFTICTAHIYYGDATANNPQRLAEIESLAQTLADQVKSPYSWAKNMILLGDFNIFDTTDATMKAITKAGFIIPEALQQKPSDAGQTKHYDQIAFIAPDLQDKLNDCQAGVFNFYEQVYKLEDEAIYKKAMGKAYTHAKDGNLRSERSRTTYYKQWRTFQMSDHLPMWIELDIDYSRQYLQRKLEERQQPENVLPEALPSTPPAE